MDPKTIDVQFIKVFLDSFVNVFRGMFKCELSKAELSMMTVDAKDSDVIVLTGITGDYRSGMVAYSMSSLTAERMIRHFYPENALLNSDSVVWDGLGELVNIISGNTLSNLYEQESGLRITTPSIVSGDSFRLHFMNQSTVTATVMSEFGTIGIDFAIKRC
jgi:CheY-specific phosphatase CheX